MVEDLRYPDTGYGFFIDRRKGSVSYGGGSQSHGLKENRVNLEEIDELMTALFTGCVTPEFIGSLLFLGDAREQYLRENMHSFI
jgi:hypothetical protein